jgi:putative transposase
MPTVTHNLHHSPWECKYQVVFPPQYRQKVLSGMSRRDLQDGLHRLATQTEGVLAEGALLPAHVHRRITMPPQHRVASMWGFRKGKSSIWIAQTIANKQRNFAGHKFWARGSVVSTVGVKEKVVRAYSENPEKEERRLADLLTRS